MIIRIRGKEGAKRVEVDQDMVLRELYQQVASEIPEAAGSEFHLSTDPAGHSIVPMEESHSLRECGLSQGQMIFLHVRRASSVPEPAKDKVTEDEVDGLLAVQEGRIKRNRDTQYCQHAKSGMCSHCQPLEPYDAGYAEQKGIKHLSFHAYLRKLGIERYGQVAPSGRETLEEPSFKVRSNCNRHPPYPQGICSQCQPSAITLNPQPFRFTDHVEFASPALVENFLAGWRSMGYQRFGWLYGRYEVYGEVPLGIKAVVQYIYEPPQDGSIDGFQLLEDEQESLIESAASRLGLQRVGMLYTDLRDDGTRAGKVEHRRGADTFFLSSAECIFVAEQQRSHPNPCRYSPLGQYGSKFATVVLSGDESHNVELFPYQVSVTAMAMVDADLIRATTDPALMMVVEGSPTHYVPEVIYKYKNEYGSETQALARPTFPVEYLIVSLSHGFPLEADPLFSSARQFKLSSGGDKSLEANLRRVIDHLIPIPANEENLLRLLSDFNLFAMLHNLSGIISPTDLDPLTQAICLKDLTALARFTLTDSWKNLLAYADGGGGSGGGRAEAIHRVSPVDLTSLDIDQDAGDVMELEAGWDCPHCTFYNANPTADNCKVCNLPRRWDN